MEYKCQSINCKGLTKTIKLNAKTIVKLNCTDLYYIWIDYIKYWFQCLASLFQNQGVVCKFAGQAFKNILLLEGFNK